MPLTVDDSYTHTHTYGPLQPLWPAELSVFALQQETHHLNIHDALVRIFTIRSKISINVTTNAIVGVIILCSQYTPC